MDPTKNYYEAFKTDFKKIDGSPADTHEEYVLYISLNLKYENELNNLGFEFYEDEDEDNEDDLLDDRYYLTNKKLGVIKISLEFPSTLDGYYLRNKKLGVLKISLGCPSTVLWYREEFPEKALELLKIKSEWLEYLSVTLTINGKKI